MNYRLVETYKALFPTAQCLGRLCSIHQSLNWLVISHDCEIASSQLRFIRKNVAMRAVRLSLRAQLTRTLKQDVNVFRRTLVTHPTHCPRSQREPSSRHARTWHLLHPTPPVSRPLFPVAPMFCCLTPLFLTCTLLRCLPQGCPLLQHRHCLPFSFPLPS